MSGGKDAAYVSDTSTRRWVNQMMQTSQRDSGSESGELNSDGSSGEPRSDSDNISQWDGDADNEESDGDADNEKSDEDEDPPSDRGISTCLTREESAVARAVDDAGCGYPFLKRNTACVRQHETPQKQEREVCTYVHCRDRDHLRRVVDVYIRVDLSINVGYS